MKKRKQGDWMCKEVSDGRPAVAVCMIAQVISFVKMDQQKILKNISSGY